MDSLEKIYNKHKKGDWPDKGSIHSYIHLYGIVLKPYRSDARNILEIGLMSGESLRMWDEYFEGTVYGMDCDIKPIDGKADLTQAIEDGLNIVIGDAANAEHIKKHFDGIKFDVIIEDANHDVQQQLDIFKVLKPYLKKGGLYIIEDIQDVVATGNIFKELGFEILDYRHVKNRYDDVLAIFKNK